MDYEILFYKKKYKIICYVIECSSVILVIDFL